MRSLAILAILALAACQEGPPEPVSAGAFGPEVAAQAETACLNKGGRWGRGGLSGGMICYETTRDANQSCDSADDCQGLCLARSRTCSPVTPVFGCNDILTSLGAEATLCID